MAWTSPGFTPNVDHLNSFKFDRFRPPNQWVGLLGALTRLRLRVTMRELCQLRIQTFAEVKVRPILLDLSNPLSGEWNITSAGSMQSTNGPFKV